VYASIAKEFFTASRGDGASSKARKIRVRTQRTWKGPDRHGLSVRAGAPCRRSISAMRGDHGRGRRRAPGRALDCGILPMWRPEHRRLLEFGCPPGNTGGRDAAIQEGAAASHPRARNMPSAPMSFRQPEGTKPCSMRWGARSRRGGLRCAHRARESPATAAPVRSLEQPRKIARLGARGPAPGILWPWQPRTFINHQNSLEEKRHEYVPTKPIDVNCRYGSETLALALFPHHDGHRLTSSVRESSCQSVVAAQH